MKKIVSRLSQLILFGAVCLVSVTACQNAAILHIQSGNMLADYEWQDNQAQFSVPFTIYDGHILLNVAVNGQENLRLALDTGAAATVVFETPRTKNMPLAVAQTFDLNGYEVNILSNVLVELGALTINDLTMIHVPSSQTPFFSSPDEAYFDGAIGADIFTRYNVKIDMDTQQVTFYQQANPNRYESWVIQPMTVAGRLAYTEVTLNDRQYMLEIDTGAPNALYINSEIAEGFTFPSEFIAGHSKNFDGEHAIKTSRLSSAVFAGSPFSDIAIRNISAFKDNTGVGLIGMDLLGKFNMYFDYENNTMALQRRQQISTDTRVDRSGLVLEPHTRGAVVKAIIGDVISVNATPLESLQEGSIVTRINNTVVNINTFDSLRQLLSSANNSVNLCWENKTTLLCEDIVLKDRF